MARINDPIQNRFGLLESASITLSAVEMVVVAEHRRMLEFRCRQQVQPAMAAMSAAYHRLIKIRVPCGRRLVPA
jgi:hypothetical protein